MNLTLLITTLGMAAIGLFRVKFWQKLFVVLVTVMLGYLLMALMFAFEQSWELFSRFIWSKKFWLPALGFLTSSTLLHVIRREKEILLDPQESKSDAAFPWFLLAIFSAFIAVIAMIALFYRFEMRWFVWIPIFVIYAIGAFWSLAKMNSDKRKQMLITSLSIYTLAVTGLIILILT